MEDTSDASYKAVEALPKSGGNERGWDVGATTGATAVALDLPMPAPRLSDLICSENRPPRPPGGATR